MEIVGEKSRYALQEHLHLVTAPLQVIWGKHDQVNLMLLWPNLFHKKKEFLVLGENIVAA